METFVFRKINGRIIPIKIKDQKAQPSRRTENKQNKSSIARSLVGAGLFSTGMGISFAGGNLSRSLMEKVKKTKMETTKITKKGNEILTSDFLPKKEGQLTLDDFATAKKNQQKIKANFTKARNLSKKTQRIFFNAQYAKYLGPAIGGVIAGVGIYNVSKGIDRQISEEKATALGLGAAAASYGFGRHGEKYIIKTVLPKISRLAKLKFG